MNGGSLEVIDSINLQVMSGEFVGFVGPSGCGKSTLLRIIAGIERAGSGSIAWPGCAGGATPSLSFAFQHLALLPWRTVSRNVGFPLEVRGDGQDLAGKVNRLIDAFGLKGFGGYYPSQLSGGMRQRVALARALITDPKLLILDEPFGALDVRARLQLQELILNTCSGAGVSVIIVTHDLHEAVRLSDRILVFSARPARVIDEIVMPPWSKEERLKVSAGQTAPFVERLQRLL